MLIRTGVIALALALFSASAVAQEEAPKPGADGAPADQAPEKPGDDKDGKVVKRAGGKEKVRVLKPADVPAELMRLKSKADIKVEVTIRMNSGRPVIFKGVIRNGKLIERIIDRRFVPQKDIEHQHSGVRVWWIGGADGFIFFRYNTIKTIAITGKLSAEERREIMRRLKANRDGTDGEKPAAATTLEQRLEKMSPPDLKAYLLKKYPYEQGWDHERMRALKRKELIENKVLTAEEATFLKYFSILVEAHFEALKRGTQKKIEIEPGSGKSDPEKPEESGTGTGDGVSNDG